MISVTIYRAGHQYRGFLCEGHAGYAEEGYDIICSAVSALTVNTINSIETLTEDEINAILSGITDSRQKTVCSYALHRVGYPYSQDLRDSGNYYDCSSLAYYSWKDAGVDISHGGATTAAAEAQGLDEAGKTVTYDQLQPGDLIFYSFTSNGRYMNISHVAVYVGNGKVVEALNESLGVVYRDVASTGKIVVIGRP